MNEPIRPRVRRPVHSVVQLLQDGQPAGERVVWATYAIGAGDQASAPHGFDVLEDAAVGELVMEVLQQLFDGPAKPSRDAHGEATS